MIRLHPLQHLSKERRSVRRLEIAANVIIESFMTRVNTQLIDQGCQVERIGGCRRRRGQEEVRLEEEEVGGVEAVAEIKGNKGGKV